MKEQAEQGQDVDAIADGEEAERLLQSPVFAKAVKRLENTYTALWKVAKSPEEREQYWQRIQVLEDVLLGLRAVRQDGVVERKKVDAEERKAAALSRTSRGSK